MNPSLGQAALKRGLEAQRQGATERAIAEYRRAVKLEPGLPAAHFNLAQLLRERGEYAAAAQSFEGAARLRPMAGDAWINLGAMYERLERFTDAISAYERVIACDPEGPSGYYNRGNAYAAMGQWDPSIASYKQAIGFAPDHVDAHWNMGCAQLASGNYKAGWAQYDWRWRRDKLDPTRGWPWPLWNGEPVAGKRVLVWREQGLGDEILFASAVRELVARGAEVTLVASPRLTTLFARAFPGVEVVPDQAGDLRSPAEFDFHTPIGSLPRFLRLTRDSFPLEGRYLVAETKSATRWTERLSALGSGLTVGICWRSGLITEQRKRQYTSLLDWGPLFALPAITWVNLQYDECEAEMAEAEAEFGIRIHRWPGEDLKNDLEGVVGLLASLDACVTAPTAVSSLAGAVGTATWELDAGGDWTAHGEERSPWFHSIRMARRSGDHPDWTPVIRRVARELSAFASAHHHAFAEVG